jgi:hypothetical protein
MNTQQITIVYSDVEIRYDESSNRWNFELRGRERFADSLKAAKEAIDKPEPVKKKPFARISAFRTVRWPMRGQSTFEKVEVTSVAAREGDGPSIQVWVVTRGSSEKVAANSIYQDTPGNIALMETYVEREKEVERLQAEKTKIEKSLTRIEIPSED